MRLVGHPRPHPHRRPGGARRGLAPGRLGAAGLTNREIGERIFLPPRTVGFHLYRVFPELGIIGRAQLRDALAESPEPLNGTPGP